MIVKQGRAAQIIGRWHDTRLLGPEGWTAPYMYDRKTAALTPFVSHHRDEWVYDEDTEQWYAAIRGGSGWSSIERPLQIIPATSVGLNPSQNTTALDTAYVYGSAGDAVAVLYRDYARTVSGVYAYLVTKTGTIPGNDINYEIRDSASSAPGTNIQSGGSGTIDISSITAPSWISVNGLSVSLSADTEYWAVIADASAVDASNFATILRHAALFAAVQDHVNHYGMHTTDGYNTVKTVATQVMSVILIFSDGTAIGCPWTASVAPASTTNRRGMYFSTGFSEKIKFWGMTGNGTVSNINGLEIYPSSAGVPGTGALSIGSLIGLHNITPALIGYSLVTPYTFDKDAGYRVVFTFSASSTGLTYYNIGTGADSNLAKAMPGGGGWYYTLANGTTDWSNDVTTGMPRSFMIFENQVAVTGGLARIIGG